MKKLRKIMAGVLAVAICMANMAVIARAEELDYSDYVPGAMPENLITASSIVTQRNGGEVAISHDSTKSEIVYTMNDNSASKDMYVFTGSSFIAKNATGGSIKLDNYKANTTYVYKTKVKNATENTELGNPYYGIAYIKDYGYNNGTGTNEYGKAGMEVSSRDWMDFKATITYPADWNESSTAAYKQTIHVGMAHRKSPNGTKIIASTNLNDMYLAEEIAYDIAVDAAENKLDSESELVISAEVVNQIGLPGKLDQSINWIALNADRTAVIDKIHITETKVNEAKITVDKDTEYGSYVILAQAENYDGFQKGFEIEVTKSPVKDYQPAAKPENLVQKPSNSGFAIASASGVVSATADDGVYTLEAKDNVTAPAEGLKVRTIMSNGIPSSYDFVPGKTYTISAEVRNPDTTKDVYFNAFMGNSATENMALTNEYGEKGMKLTSDWQMFNITVTLPTTYDVDGEKTIVLGLNNGTATGAKAEVKLSVYIAEEALYDIELTPSKTDALGAEDNMTVTAAVVNQVGTAGSHKQNFTWYLYDADKVYETTELLMEVADDTKSAKLSTDIFTIADEYYAVAKSNDYPQLIKTAKIVVNKSSAKDCVIEFLKTATEEEITSKLPEYLPALKINTAGVNFEGTAKLITASRNDSVTDYVALTQKAVAVAAYKNLSNVYDKDGNFTEDKALDLKALDKGGVTLYELFNEGITADGKIALHKELQGEYTSFDDFEKKFMEQVILKSIEYPENSGKGFIAEILTKENASAAGIVADEFLALTDKTEASEFIMKKSFTKATLESAVAGIDKTIADSKEEDKKPTGSSNSRPSSGTSSIAPSEPPENTPKEDEEKAQDIKVKLFDDVTSSHWAYSDVYYLTGLEVLDGVDANRFNPEGLLSREQLVKILCTAFEYELLNGECRFTDVQPGAWYTPYVVTAVDKGVVKGINETTFGVGRSITREDICVMITRALGVELTGDFDMSFTDAETISAYAEGSVAYLSSIGVINGFSDGTFGPKKSCTRAQAAKIISTILNMEGVNAE